MTRDTPNGHLTRHAAVDVTGLLRCKTCGAIVELSWSPLGRLYAYCRGIDPLVDTYPDAAVHDCDPMVVLPASIGGLATMVGDDATVNAFHNDWRDKVRTTWENLLRSRRIEPEPDGAGEVLLSPMGLLPGDTFLLDDDVEGPIWVGVLGVEHKEIVGGDIVTVQIDHDSLGDQTFVDFTDPDERLRVIRNQE